MAQDQDLSFQHLLAQTLRDMVPSFGPEPGTPTQQTLDWIKNNNLRPLGSRTVEPSGQAYLTDSLNPKMTDPMFQYQYGIRKPQ